MTQLRYLFAATSIWFFVLYNIERISAPINIDSFVYLLIGIAGVVVILVPRLYKISMYWLLGSALLLYVGIKLYLGHPLGGTHLTLTVTEICAIGVMIFLAMQIGQRLEEMRTLVTNLTIGANNIAEPFTVGQGYIYREIRRARRHQRPATLLSIAVTKDANSAVLQRFEQDVPLRHFIQDIQRELVEKYVLARVADLLVDQLEDSAVITRRNDHFVTLLPEIDRDEVLALIDKLQKAVDKELGLHFKIGASTFPDEALTFESLLEQAEAKMFGGDATEGATANNTQKASTVGVANEFPTGATAAITSGPAEYRVDKVVSVS
jgi:GGDEF domain-containing protein